MWMHAGFCRVVPCRVVSCRVGSCRVVSCCVVSCLIVSCVVLCCVVLCYVIFITVPHYTTPLYHGYILLCYIILQSNCIKQGLIDNPTRVHLGKNIRRILWDRKVHCRVFMNVLLNPLLGLLYISQNICWNAVWISYIYDRRHTSISCLVLIFAVRERERELKTTLKCLFGKWHY